MIKGYTKSPKKKSIKKAYDSMENSMDEMKPTIHLSDKDLPAISKWKVGQTYTVTMKIRQTGVHENYNKDGNSADFEVESVEVVS